MNSKEEKKMEKGTIKLNRAYDMYTGFKGRETVGKVFRRIPDELVQSLTAKQIAAVAEIVAQAYEDGRASTGAEMIDNNAVYINSLDKVIEWNEEGAEYKRVQEKKPGYTVTRNEKTKEGVLVPRFSE